MSKRALHAAGWKGPAVVLKQEGLTRVYISYRGVLVLVAPHPLRKATTEELRSVELADVLDELLAQRPRGSVTQRSGGKPKPRHGTNQLCRQPPPSTRTNGRVPRKPRIQSHSRLHRRRRRPHSPTQVCGRLPHRGGSYYSMIFRCPFAKL